MAMPDLEAQARLRVKAVTAVLTAITAASLLLFDWDAVYDRPTVFSSIRPAVKRALNGLYGTQPSASPPGAPEQRRLGP